jgi:hypothetical protein
MAGRHDGYEMRILMSYPSWHSAMGYHRLRAVVPMAGRFRERHRLSFPSGSGAHGWSPSRLSLIEICPAVVMLLFQTS